MFKRKPIIGVIPGMLVKDDEEYDWAIQNNKPLGVPYFEDIEINNIIKAGGIPIGILGNDITYYESICDGFLLTNEYLYFSHHKDLIKNTLKNNKPILGINKGTIGIIKALGLENNFTIIDRCNMDLPTTCNIRLDKNTILASIYKADNIDVLASYSLKVNKKTKDIKLNGFNNDLVNALEYNKNVLSAQFYYEKNINDISLHKWLVSKAKKVKDSD